MKIIIIVFILVLGIFFIFTPHLKNIAINTLSSPSPAIIPLAGAMDIPCQSGERRTNSISEVLQNPKKVCNFIVTSDDDMSKLSSVGNLLTNLQLLTIKDVSAIKIPDTPSLLTLQILDIGLEENEGEKVTSEESLINTENAENKNIEEVEGYVIPPRVEKLSNLTMLYVAETAFKSLPSEIGELSKLRKLLLLNNPELTVLPVSVVKLQALNTVLFRENPKLKIPDSLFSHQSLDNITITGGNITKIPPPVYRLGNLKILAYKNNKISSVSAAIADLTSLRVINFESNQLIDFPSVDRLVNLEDLDLCNNQLTGLPKGIERLKKLKALRVSDNNIDDSTTEVLQQLTELETLDLGNNKLSKLPPGIEKLKKLQYLRLAGNKVDKDSLDSLKELLPQANVVY